MIRERCVVVKRTYTKKQKKIMTIAAIVVVGVCLLVELIGMIPGIPFNGWSDVGIALGLKPPPVIPEGELEVHFLDMGNADCILVRQGDKNMLIDAAEPDNREDIIRYLQRQGVQKLDLVIATHPHADHIGAMFAVVEEFPIDRFVMSYVTEEATPTSNAYIRMLEALDTHNVAVEEAIPGTTYELGTARLQIVAPFEAVEDANDVSVVCRLTFGERSFLFTGDAGKKVENQMLDSPYVLRSDVLKLSHHGSNSGNSERFLYEVMPQYAVITCGEGNSYGHPHQEVMTRLKRQQIQSFRSDLHGTIVFKSDGQELTVITEKG